MNKLKYLAVVLIAVAGLGLQQAKANIITFVGEFSTPNQNQSSILSVANANGVDADEPTAGDLSVDVRLTASINSVTNQYGTFSYTTVTTGEYLVSFSLNAGYVLAGIAVHNGAGNLDNFYSVNDETSGTLEGPVFTPINHSGGHGALSNLDFLLETAGTSVPDGGTTAMLLGAALGALGMARRFLMS